MSTNQILTEQYLEATSSPRHSKICQLMIHDVRFVLDFSLTIEPGLVPVGPDSAHQQGHVLVPVTVTWHKNKEEIYAGIDVKKKTADVVQAKDPGRQAILVPLQAVDEFVDGGSFVDVEEVCWNVADEEGHDNAQENGG